MKCHQQCVFLLLQVIFFVANCLTENLIFNINFKKPIAVTDHAFLSFTLDPTTLQHNDLIKNIERSTNLARGLAPAYIRLGGPQSNFYNFEQTYSHEIDSDPNDMYFGKQWTLIYQWAKNAGLDIIVCITPHYIANESKIDLKNPRNIAELLSFTDRMGYNISWQLGYECQTRCNFSGKELGRYVTNLREILKTFPRYSNSLITGPDIVTYKTVQQQKYLQDYLHSASTALSAITWHPDLDSVFLNNDNISIHDNIVTEKDKMYKILNLTAENKPLWIAESKPTKSKRQYLEALIWTRRLGDTAKLGIQVVMRQLSDLFQATPVYWVSLLYKTLVGREVLEMKLQSENENHVHFYSQCTKSSTLYSKGAITIFGINLTPKKVIVDLKGPKIKILHKYILSPDFETGNKMFSEKVLLNNKSLYLINDKELPDINPEIIINPDGLELELPSGGIGFWVIPNAKVKACIFSEEETIEDNIVKKLSKRHENDNRQEEKEEDINQSTVIEDDVKENISQLNLKSRKIYGKQDRKKQIENSKSESQQKVWSSKLLEKIKKILQKQLQKKDRKNKSSNLQRSFIIELGQENSFEEVEEEQQNLDQKDLKKTEINDKFKSIRDILKKYKYILLEKKVEMETEGIQDFEPEIQNINNIMALISKIDASLLYKVTSNESIMSKLKNEEESIIKIDKKLKGYLTELENSAEIKSNIIKKIEKHFNKLYNLLENNNSAKNNKNSHNQISSHENLMKGKRLKRHIDRKSKNSKTRILKKRSQIDNSNDHIVKQKIKWKNDNGKETNLITRKLISYDNLKKNFNNNEKKYNDLFQRELVNKFESDFENAAHHIDYQHLVQGHKKIETNNIYRKNSKIDDKYQCLLQDPERIKRDINKKLVEIGLKRNNTPRRHPRIDDLKSYINEKKTKQNDIKRGLLSPFNPKITDSNENNFYGFFRREPIKGFPEGDIFITTGDSLEQNGKDYDYVEDEDDSEKKNTQHNKKLMLDHTEDKNTLVKEVENDCDYIPNEFFENIKLSNLTRIKENSKNYDDLWEAEFPSEEHNNSNNNNNNNNNKITIAEVIQNQPINKEKEKRTRETNIQHTQLDNYNSENKKYDQDALQLASRYSSMPFDQLSKTPNSNIQASNIELREVKLKMEPEAKISNSFYLPFQASTKRYNYDNYINYDKIKIKDEKDLVTNIDSKNDISAKTTQNSRPSIHTDHSIYNKIFHNERNKRSNWDELQKIFAEEMIMEDEENAKDCHCRVIRASDSKKLYHRRINRNISVPTIPNTYSENKNVSTNVAQSKKSVQTPITREEYEEIMMGEILPSTNIIEPTSEENDTTMKSVITESSILNHKLNDTIDETSISRVNNVSEQYHNMKKSTTSLLPVDSASEFSLNNNNSIEYVTKETFFRTQPSDIQSKNKTKTYDSSQVISKIPSENKVNLEGLVVCITKNAQETTEKVQVNKVLINKEEKANSSIYSTITKDQKNEEGHDNNYKIGLKSTNFLKETSKEITEQVTTETILSKRAASAEIDNSKSNESEANSKSNKSKTDSKLLRNIMKDNQNSESKVQKDNTRKLKTILKNLSRASLEKFTRYEEYLIRRAEQIDKCKEKLYARREKLLHQYQNDLIKIKDADQQKRNLKRREIWEKLCESDDFYRLIDQGVFIGVLINDDVIYEDDDKNYLIPIELVPKQYNNITNQIYLLAKAKKVRYPEHNKYQFFRNLIENNEKLAEKSDSSEHKHNQYYEYIPKIIESKQGAKARFLDYENNQDYQASFKTIEDERETTEPISRSLNRKVFIIDPSTYYGGEPILQSYENYLKFPKCHSKIKSQIQDPISRWILRSQVLSKLKSSEDQHQASKSQEYVKKLPIKDYYDQGNANILYVLDAQKQYNLQEELAALAQVWLNSLDRRDVNRAISNKETNKLNNMHKNLRLDKDNLDSTSAVNKKTRDSEIERNIENKEIDRNKEFDSSDNKKKDIMNLKMTEHNEEKTKKSENIELTKHEEINKSYNSNNKTENNLNIKIPNHNKTDEHVKENIDDNFEAKEFGNMRTRRDIEDIKKLTNKRATQTPQFRLIEYEKNNFFLKEKSLKEIFSDKSIFLILEKRDIPLNADLFRKSKNYLISSRDFKVNQENEKEHETSNYITLIPIEIKNIFEMLDVKNNDDSLERFDISTQWNDQNVQSEKISNLINKYLDESSKEYLDETSEEFEYEDLSNLQNESTENTSDDESTCKNEQDVSVKNSEAESEKDEQYEITSDEIDKYLKIKNQVGSNERGMFFLLPWRSMKKRQLRQTKNEINGDTVKIKRETTRHSQSNKSILAEDLEENKRTKRYLNNNIDQKEEENIIGTNDINVNYLQSQINRKNRDNLLEDFIKAHKKNNLYNNEASSLRNEEKEIIPLNIISKSNKKFLQDAIPKLQNYAAKEFDDNSKENFNDTLMFDEDNHDRNKTSGTTINVFYDAIMNIKDFFTFFSKISQLFMI